MRIKAFSYFLADHMTPHKLNDTTVVVDGQNMFFGMYQKSKLQYALGCESDRYAQYLKTYLEKFKKANMKCYFVFKGGHTDKTMLGVHYEAENRLHGRNFEVGIRYDDDIVKPIFEKDMWFQVLTEMGFEYVVCNGDHITECIILARKLCCPVLSFNIQYFFSEIQYIPENSIKICGDNLMCGVVTTSMIWKKFNLTKERLILFLMLADQHIFDETVFTGFFKHHKIAKFKLNMNLIQWLSRYTEEQALNHIFKFISKSQQDAFFEKKSHLENIMLAREKIESKTTLYVIDKNQSQINQLDPDWFEKGVFLKYIDIPYINLYRFKTLTASHFIEDYEQENAVILSLDIIKYGSDLLCNFRDCNIVVEHKNSSSDDNKEQTLTYECSIQKPDALASCISSIFENGWDNIKELNLFQHFIIETLQSFNFDRLNMAPADCRLLLVATVYFAQKKSDVKKEILSILLSYVMLGVVFDKIEIREDNGCNKENVKISEKPFIDSLTNKDLVNPTDCSIAWSIMKEYFQIKVDELCYKFDRRLIHPLVELQRCLQELNYLNRLCASPFDATIYSKTYNGTFVYKILYSMTNADDPFEFIKTKLNPAPTVVAFFTGLVEIYEAILYGI